MKNDIKKTLGTALYHGGILFKGFIKMLCGALMTVLIVAGGYGLAMVQKEAGYAAVCDFVVSICIMFISISGMYLMGGTGKKGAKK